jgi:hypothetical protein
MVNKILICIESDNVNLRGGAEIKPGEKYIIVWRWFDILEDYVSDKNRLCRIHQGDNLVGFFSAENIDKYFQPIEDYRNNIIDKLLNYETKTTI